MYDVTYDQCCIIMVACTLPHSPDAKLMQSHSCRASRVFA
jgi:hypothetical protein